MGEVGGIRVGVEEEVGAGPGAGDRGSLRPAEILDGDGQERVGDRDALEAEPAAQLTGRDRAGEGGRAFREGGEDRRAQHHHFPAGIDEAPVGRLVDSPQTSPSGARSAGPRRRCWCWRSRSPGSAWRWRRPPLPAAPSANGTAGRLDRGGGRAEAAFGRRRSSPPGSGHVEHRREVDVDADVLAGSRAVVRPWERLKAAPRSPISWADTSGRAADPLHQASLLVDHHQQRVAQSARARDRLQARDQLRARRLGWGGCR